MAQHLFKVDGMSCGHCQKAVTEAVSALAGVESVTVSLEAGTADVTYNDAAVSAQAIVAAIEEQGYDAAE
jgi:copper chaperone